MRYIKFLAIFVLIFASCRKEIPILPPSNTDVNDKWEGDVKGFFLLNQGNMGSNKASLDFYDYEKGIYSKNIFPERNPNVVSELGDVGNDLEIYGDKLYAVINCSNLVEIMDVNSAKHISQVSIPNCRYIAFNEGFAYVSSYAGPVELGSNSRLGYIAKIDTATLQVVDTCVVGYQPEQMAVYKDRLYVANSGGYDANNYDYRVSVIDLNSFKETKKIPVAINLNQMLIDNQSKIWVSSRGDYYENSSKLYVLDPERDKVIDSLDIAGSAMARKGDSLYVVGVNWSYVDKSNTVSYAIVNTANRKVVTTEFITDGTQKNIVIPYALAINPLSGDIFVSDATNYVTPGKLHCYSPLGKKKWSVTTGDIPAAFAFTNKKLQPNE